MATGLYILQRAARAAHILASSETFQPGEANDALDIANGMLDSWNAEKLMMFTIPRQVFALTSGQQTYPVGSTAAAPFNIPRPARITGAGVITLANPSQPLELPLDLYTVDEWARIPVKNIPASLPSVFYDDDAFPNRNFNLYPVPNVSTLQIALYFWQQLTAITLAAQYTLPPGYYEALIYNLAVKMAAEWPGEVTEQVQQMAAESKLRIKSINSKPVDLRCDPALNSPKLRAYNWISDTPISK